MTALRIHFCDFSSDFVPEDDFFYALLSRRHRVVLDCRRPDYLIYSCYGYEFLNYDCPRIFYTAENLRPDFNLCDYAIGFDYLTFGDRYCRFPNYARYGKQFESLVRKRIFCRAELGQKRGFCNFVYSNSFADPTRDRFFRLLSEYKRVDSPGRHLNNMPSEAGDRHGADWRLSKVEFQRNYKFSIAFENSSAPGYTTEKIMHAFIADTVPIYLGNPLVAREFNPGSFVNCHDFSSLEKVVQRVAELDNNDDQYLAMLNEPCLHGNTIPAALSKEMLLDFFTHIFSQPPAVCRRRPSHGTTMSYESHLRNSRTLAARRDALMRVVKSSFRPFKAILNR
jgi:hypothetical protein